MADAAPERLQPWWVLPMMGMIGEVVFVVGLVLSYRLENATLFNVALGASIGQAQMVISYFFGSSAGSAKKDDVAAATAIKKEETIAVMAAALPPSAPVAPIVMSEPPPPPPLPPDTKSERIIL